MLQVGEEIKDYSIDEEVDQPEPPTLDTEAGHLEQDVVDNDYPHAEDVGNNVGDYEEVVIDTLAGSDEYGQINDPLEPGEYVEDGEGYGPVDDDQGYILEDEGGEDPREYDRNFQGIEQDQSGEYRQRPGSMHDDGIGIAEDGIIEEAYEDDGTIDRMFKKKQRR